MAKNKLEDVRNHLIAQMERLNDENISEESMSLELKKAKAMADVAKPIVEFAKIEAQLLLKSESFMKSDFLGLDNTKQLGQ